MALMKIEIEMELALEMELEEMKDREKMTRMVGWQRR
jgi:hypothetical protein